MDKETRVFKESLKMTESYDKQLSKYATKNSDCIKVRPLKQLDEFDLRWPFEEDIDRVLYSKGYPRYADKTQALSFYEDVHITRRSLHVQMVSRIGRQIGRRLNLNLDLIEAIALGHDLGHTPYGHVGERVIDSMLQEKGFGYFAHNANSVRRLMFIERYGVGYNVSLQVLDGILCHNGEMLTCKYAPDFNKTKEQFFEEYEKCWTEKNYSKKISPMTLEGCVVRVSDVIAYIGKDIEDALRVGLIKLDQIPQEIVEVLGKDNRTMINRLIGDLVIHSYNKPYLTFSNEVFNALQDLLMFIQRNIHREPEMERQNDIIKRMVRELFESFYQDLEENRHTNEGIFTFINKMNEAYKKNSHALMVSDYLSGMTDSYLLQWYEKRFMPKKYVDVLD